MEPYEIVRRWTWAQFWLVFDTLEDEIVGRERDAQRDSERYARGRGDGPGRSVGIGEMFTKAKAHYGVRPWPRVKSRN